MSIYDRFEKYADKTFADAAARYLLEFQGKDKRRPEIAIDAVMPYIGHMKLIDIDDGALAQYKHDRMNGVGHFDKAALAGTANKELTQTLTILNKACRVWRWLPSTPQFIRVNGKRRTAYPLSWAEQDRLFRFLPTGWCIGAALFAVNTGVRRGELFGLKWTDMVELPELDTFVFILRDTKNGKDRAVICNSFARRAVEQQKGNGSEYVFPSKSNRNQRGKIRDDSRVWLNAWAKAGLPSDPMIRKGIHNLRHTFAHRLRAAGVPEEDRNSLLGHRSHNLAQHYALPDVKRLLAAAELVTERRDTTVLRSVPQADIYIHG